MEKSVLVLGGGIAGLTAATQLVAGGWHVTVLEAKQRFGGRIHTVRHGTLPVELGAEFVHGKNASLAHLLHEAQLSTHEVPGQNRVWKNGRLEPVPLWEKVGEILDRIDPHRPDESFEAFLNRGTTRPDEREMALGFVQGFNAADPAHASTHALLRAEAASEQEDGSRQWRLDQGYCSLVDWLHARLESAKAMLTTGATVRQVKWQPGEVEVWVETQSGSERLRATAALITLPLGVLKAGTVRFEPSLIGKREAIEALQFGNARKLALLFREVWWPQQDFGFVHCFDEALPTWWSDPRGSVLTGWAGGPKADALTRKTADELKTIGLGILSKLFSQPVKALQEQLVGGYTHDWASDPQIHGAYSYIPVGGLDLPKLLAEPIGSTLFFAGEATVRDAQMGTVFGAVETGLRAAEEIRGR